MNSLSRMTDLGKSISGHTTVNRHVRHPVLSYSEIWVNYYKKQDALYSNPFHICQQSVEVFHTRIDRKYDMHLSNNARVYIIR
jgi:hypothetical protein